MNPLTNMKNVKKLSEQDLNTGNKSSWHNQYRDSAWIFVGGLPYDLTEGDIICIFSQYGEIVNINLIRDKDTGKSKGFCFICYEDQRSTDLAVDNFNGIKILKRTIRVDHVADYKVPKDGKKTDDATKKLHEEGCAPKSLPVNLNRAKQQQDEFVRETLADQITSELKLPPRLPIDIVKQEKVDDKVTVKKEKKEKKKEKKRKKKKKRRSDLSSNTESDSDDTTTNSDSLKNYQDNKHSSSSKSRPNYDSKLRTHSESQNFSSKIEKGKSKSSTEIRQVRSRSSSVERKKYKPRSRSRSTERHRYRHRSRSSSVDKSKKMHRTKSGSKSPERNKHRYHNLEKEGKSSKEKSFRK